MWLGYRILIRLARVRGASFRAGLLRAGLERTRERRRFVRQRRDTARNSLIRRGRPGERGYARQRGQCWRGGRFRAGRLRFERRQPEARIAGRPQPGFGGLPGASAAGSAGASSGAGAAQRRRFQCCRRGGGSAAFVQVSSILGKNCGIKGCHADKQSPHFVPDAMLYAMLTGPNTVLAACDYTRLVEEGDPAKSALVRLMNRKCGSFTMPPSCNKTTCISAADLKALSDWIQPERRRRSISPKRYKNPDPFGELADRALRLDISMHGALHGSRQIARGASAIVRRCAWATRRVQRRAPLRVNNQRPTLCGRSR